MSKRTKTQLTKDTILAHDDLSSDGESEMQTPQIASSAVMANRKIAGMGRRFGKKTQSVPNTSSLQSNIELSQMKSLNANFLKSINDGINKNSIADLSEICNKYISYINKINDKKIEVKNLSIPKVEIKKETIQSIETNTQTKAESTSENKANPFAVFSSFGKTTTSTTPTTTSKTPTTTSIKPVFTPSKKEEPIKTDVASGSSDDEEKEVGNKEIKLQGPTFKLDKLPTTKNGFKFGYAPPKDASDSEDEIEIKGPTFKLNAAISDSTFSFPKKTNQSAKSANGLSFGAPKIIKTDETKPAESKPAESKPVESKPVESKPVESKPVESKPVESKPVESKPAFSFTASVYTKSEQPTPSFSSISTTSAKPEENAKTSFSFNKPDESKPSFSFGSAPPATSSKPTFNFASSSTTTTEPSTANPKPKFSFNPPAPSTTTTPFSFTNSTPPVLNFGVNSASSTNAFSFTKSATSTKESSNAPSVFSVGNSTSSTSNPFNFGDSSTINTSGGTSSPFTFTAPSASSSITLATKETNPATLEAVTEKDDQEESKELEKDTVKGNFAVVNLTKKVDVKTGEENEETIITKRSKILKFNNDLKSYENVGVGEFKILKNKDTGKFRILVRSDGSSNVLLNILILKEMKYEIMGDKKTIIRIPSVNGSGELETFIARVKTQQDAEEVLNKIQSCQ